MYAALLHTHNFTRWIVLVLGVMTLVKAFQGLKGDRPYDTTRRYTAMFMGSLHLQILLGLLLFMQSPTIRNAMRDMEATMADSAQRFFVAEHPTFMVIAAILMTVGSIVAKSGADNAKKHQRAAVFATLTLAIVLYGIPWGRPLFPGM